MRRVANEEKLALRGAVLSRRNALTEQECVSWSRAIQTRALHLSAYDAAHSVALYSPVQNEVDTGEILRNSLAAGRKVYFPRTAADGAGELIRVLSSSDLRAGRYAVLEPSGTEQLTGRDQEKLIVFVPGVAFDAAGNRLGRGNGWYDRILMRLEGAVTVAALAYDFQVVEEVPIDPWDRRVHYVVTETKLIDCDAGKEPLMQASH